MAVTGDRRRRTLFDEDQGCYRTSSGNRERHFGRGCVQTSAAVDGGRSFPPTPLFSGPSDGERRSRRWSAHQRSGSPSSLHSEETIGEISGSGLEDSVKHEKQLSETNGGSNGNVVNENGVRDDDELMAVETQEISAESSTIDVYHPDTTISVQQQQAEPGSNTDTTIHVYHYDSALHVFNSMPRRSSVSYNAMMSGYLRNDDFDLAREVFDKMPERDLVSWNVMISGYLRNKNLSEARELFEAMTCRNVGSWNTMITGYAQSGEITLARNLFDMSPSDTIACDSESSKFSQSLLITMSSVDIAALCNALSIKEKETPVHMIDGNLIHDGERRLGLCLMGKVMTSKIVKREVFIDVMTRIWRFNEGVEIVAIAGNIFAFYFKNVEDRQRLLSGGPWSFDRAIIIFEIPTRSGDLCDMCFNWVEFWVQIHNMPLLCMTEDIGLSLGKMIGEVKEIDLEMGRYGNTQFLRVRVVVPAEEPLQRCIRVDIMGTGKGHSMGKCSSTGEEREVKSEAGFRLALWLHAENPSKRHLFGNGKQNLKGWGRKGRSPGFNPNPKVKPRNIENWKEKGDGVLIAFSSDRKSNLDLRDACRGMNAGKEVWMSEDTSGEYFGADPITASHINEENRLEPSGLFSNPSGSVCPPESGLGEPSCELGCEDPIKGGLFDGSKVTEECDGPSLVGVINPVVVGLCVAPVGELISEKPTIETHKMGKWKRIDLRGKIKIPNSGLCDGSDKHGETEGEKQSAESGSENGVSGLQKPLVVDMADLGNTMSGFSKAGEDLKKCDENTIVWACNFVEEFQRAGAKLISSDIDQVPIAVQAVFWDRPSQGVYKVNTDAAIRVDSNLVGLGMVIRDFEGCVVGSSTQCLAANFSPLVAEATALYKGIVFALEAGLTPLIAESDSKMVVDLIHSGSSPMSDVGIIISDIFLLIRTHDILVRFAPRAANMVAHS
ncbi:hypothetical protein EZV62_000853 [Acer yangbiense]|uniref:RNase H type-1 domain-containing protein n=1 Tax=Acer yangbiense TaxID=1000413 RepID=A0A5C7ITY4_9ROSI|nr:hypothetical protein EZV62_000853 [Acer yangbiense]